MMRREKKVVKREEMLELLREEMTQEREAMPMVMMSDSLLLAVMLCSSLNQ